MGRIGTGYYVTNRFVIYQLSGYVKIENKYLSIYLSISHLKQCHKHTMRV